MYAYIDRKKKFPATLLVKALGYETNEELVKLFYETKRYRFKEDEDYDESGTLKDDFSLNSMDEKIVESIVDDVEEKDKLDDEGDLQVL